MEKTTIRTELYINYAHVLNLKESKCNHCHGHLARVEVKIQGIPNEDDGMLIDFHTIKNLVNILDHRTILNGQLYNISGNGVDYNLTNIDKHYTFPIDDCVIIDGEPTTENLCKYLYELIKELNPNNNVNITIWESASSYSQFGEKF
jgi:6-pyruvoyl-tetrahydropterin synthase